jgi:transketolase
MGSIVNGMAYHGGFLPYGATFLVFSDYMRAAVRISALSHLQSFWVYTHDSIGLGEDGPTHQPVEHLAALRIIPNLNVIRPMDANEVKEAWISAINRRHGPTALALSRQNLPTVDRQTFGKADGLHKGAYILLDSDSQELDVVLMASGSEVDLIIRAGEKLSEDGLSVRLVSFPCWELFEQQPTQYQQSVLGGTKSKKVAVEAGVGMGWEKWTGPDGLIIAMKSFGASAPAEKLFQEFGFSVEKIYQKIKNHLS